MSDQENDNNIDESKRDNKSESIQQVSNVLTLKQINDLFYYNINTIQMSHFEARKIRRAQMYALRESEINISDSSERKIDNVSCNNSNIMNQNISTSRFRTQAVRRRRLLRPQKSQNDQVNIRRVYSEEELARMQFLNDLIGNVKEASSGEEDDGKLFCI